ncbi:TIGR00730 family Rossman fold protein [Rhodohalobacter sp.]|uniref:LOG family protein n=1 Tax=Rhodohalobacter sp. TaxID=1974210 RepID=UPI002ACEEB2A|nr:TIGR00730 family Rossman fold protein [Rhodohalobacter sp.]MDZ7756588.1 TIGR00730 family Rossman fold protein [Rhodohalobacter sp.]
MNICVYCGSSPGNDPDIINRAGAFGKLLAENDHNLIYGGSSLGIMGTIADSVMVNGGEVIGVIPENLFSKEVAHRGITRLITVKDMHQRKSHMAELADAFVAFPGGFGTMEELFEIITWNQIGLLDKPVTIMNLNGYYDSLIEMMDHSVEAGFIKPNNRKIVQVAETLEECLELCEQA